MTAIKVGVWGPGSMGVVALRGVIDHPTLQLTDVIVHSPHKIGVDAGRLAGTDDTGIHATDSPDQLLTGDADVIVYAAAANLRPAEAISDMERILRTGKDVVSCSVVPLVYPNAVAPEMTAGLRDAAEAGGSSFFTSGIDTGFANDVLPLALTGVSRTVEAITVTEMFNYATYPDRQAIYEVLGFGQPEEYEAFAALPGIFTFGWGPVLHQLADALGVEIERIDESIERRIVDETFQTPTGVIERGTVGAMRSTLHGFVNGRAAIVLDHVTRMHDDLAPDWPQPNIRMQPNDLGFGGASGRGLYRVEIDGSPSMRCEFEMAEDGDHDLGARIAGASRLVNAIPAVHAATPGLLSALDLPQIFGRSTLDIPRGVSPDSRRLSE